MFSPRMRGCFYGQFRFPSRCCVLPAYAGMFLERDLVFGGDLRSPRVCGDVSRPLHLEDHQIEFSPRMRGCFPVIAAGQTYFAVLPAYAGMFPEFKRRHNGRRCSPRVCGDVSPKGRAH